MWTLWLLFDCVRFITHEICICLLGSYFRESLLLSRVYRSASVPWLAFVCMVISVLFRPRDAYNTLFASGCCLESFLFYWHGGICQPRLQTQVEDAFGDRIPGVSQRLVLKFQASFEIRLRPVAGWPTWWPFNWLNKQGRTLVKIVASSRTGLTECMQCLRPILECQGSDNFGT